MSCGKEAGAKQCLLKKHFECQAAEFGLNPASKRVACESSAGALAQTVKNLSAVQETRFNPIGSHRHRSLVGYSPWGHKGSDTTKQLTHPHSRGMAE